MTAQTLPVLTAASAQRALLSGDLTAATVSAVLPQGLVLLAEAGEHWTLDMSAVGKVSSAGVALLLEWLRAASAAGTALHIEHLPRHMMPIIRISDLQPLFAPLLRPLA